MWVQFYSKFNRGQIRGWVPFEQVCENGANADLNTFEFTEKFEIELSAHTEKILNHFRFLFEAIREIAPKQIQLP